MLWVQSQWPIMTYFFMSFQSHATTRLQRLLTIKENDSVLQHFSNYTYLLSLFPSDLWKMSRVLYLLCWYMAYSMWPNYLPNTGTSNKNLHKFVNFHSVEPKFGGLVGLRWSFPKINVSPPWPWWQPWPWAWTWRRCARSQPGHVGPDLVDGGLEGLGVGVLLDVSCLF